MIYYKNILKNIQFKKKEMLPVCFNKFLSSCFYFDCVPNITTSELIYSPYFPGLSETSYSRHHYLFISVGFRNEALQLKIHKQLFYRSLYFLYFLFVALLIIYRRSQMCEVSQTLIKLPSPN